MLETLSIQSYLWYNNIITMSENASGADNQQERFLKGIPEKLGWFLVGFTEGEGSFNLSIIKRSDYAHRWQLNLSFNISQKEGTLLGLSKEIMQCGSIRKRKDGVYAYEVRGINDIVEKVTPFFNHFKLFSQGKRKTFEAFSEIAVMMKNGEHLTVNGLTKILKLRKLLNPKSTRKRKYNDECVLDLLRKSSETTRRAPTFLKRKG